MNTRLLGVNAETTVKYLEVAMASRQLMKVMRSKTIGLSALALLVLLLCSGFGAANCRALPQSTPNPEHVSLVHHLWPQGVPRVLKWSKHGIAVGTSAGYVMVFDQYGELRWSRRLNYTPVWGVSWSEGGELAVVTLGPPGVLYVFNAQGDLLWSKEWDNAQALTAEWSGELLAVGAGGGLLVFSRRGDLVWNSTGDTLIVSWHGGRVAAGKYVAEPSLHGWALQVFSEDGKLLWSYSGVYHHLAWSDEGYLAGADRYAGRISVLDGTGSLVWEKTVEMKEIGTLKWLGELLVVGGDGGVLAFDKNGRLVWSYKGSFVEALSARGGSLAVGDYTGNLTLLDAGGRVLWNYSAYGYVWSIDWYGEKIAAASSDGYVQVLDGEGRLLWKRRVGFNVEAVAVSGDLIAIGGRDMYTYVLDFNGSLKWSRKTGWVHHLAWHGDYLAVGGYHYTFVFHRNGTLMWWFKTGKVRSLSWSDDGLLGIGCTDEYGVNRLAVFTLGGELLWSAVLPNWVTGISWSGDLLAAAVPGHGIFVSDRSGRLRFVFRSVFENATAPWRVSATWWGDRLIVITDHVYALDRDGKVLWVNELVPADMLAPGGEFVAVGSGRGVAVLDIDGELEWSYLTPDYTSPREIYTKPFLEHVYSLSWVDGYLVAGDRIGRVFVFNETGDVARVFSMVGAVWAISGGSGGVFVAGGEGGLLIAKVTPVGQPARRILTQLPPPYDRFELAIVNRTLLNASGSLHLAPSQQLSFQFEVSEGAPYAFLEASILSARPVKLILSTQGKHGEPRGTSAALAWIGTEIHVKVPLESGRYLPIILSEEETVLNYTLQAYEGFLPSFEERRVYLPVGIADYGYVDLPEGRAGYRYTFNEAWGYASIRNISAVRPFDEGLDRGWVTLQLNAFLHVNTERGKQLYWIQNVVVLDTLEKKARFASNVWNATTYPTSVLARWATEGRGSVARDRRVGDYYFYTTDWVNCSYPVEVALYISVRMEEGAVRLSFGSFLSKADFNIYDEVYLRVKAGSAIFKVDPTESPLPSNVELVFAGPHSGKPKTVLRGVEASLKLLVRTGGNLIPAPTAFSCGHATYERVANASVGYGGNYTAVLTTGRAGTRQVYYSAGTFAPLWVVVVHDPLRLYNGLLLLRAGETLPLFPGYTISLENKTRYVLRGYTPTGRNEVSLEWVRQFYLGVQSSYGEVTGGGWYNEGSYARVELREVETGFLVRRVFERWEGLRPEDKVLAPGTVEVYVDSPRMLTAIWKTDYTQLVVLMVVLGVVLAVVAYCRLAKRRSEGIS